MRLEESSPMLPPFLPRRTSEPAGLNGSSLGQSQPLSMAAPLREMPPQSPPGPQGPGVRRSLRKSRTSYGANGAVVSDPAHSERHKTALKSIFATNSAQSLPSLTMNGGEALSTPADEALASLPHDIDVDLPIDDNLHTALHWAAALSRVDVVRALVQQLGADVQRGNNNGETPLMRSVLVTNSFDADTFATTVKLLAPSLRTVDDAHRTVLHHVALVAGVHGRAQSARYYMQCLLEYIATTEHGDFSAFVNAEDVHGDTALNIAARVGNKALVRMLVDVGADKSIANKLGLRPADFGVEGEVRAKLSASAMFKLLKVPRMSAQNLEVSPGEQAVAAVRGPSLASSVTAEDTSALAGQMVELIQALERDHGLECAKRDEALARVTAQVKQSTRDLADVRGRLARARSAAAVSEGRSQRIRNLERAIEDEERFDWTGRTNADGSPVSLDSVAGSSFVHRGQGSTLTSLPPNIDIECARDPPLPDLPPRDSGASISDVGDKLAQLTRLKAWYTRVNDVLSQRIARHTAGDVTRELKLRRIVAACCGVSPPEKVDDMLDQLVAALQSDGAQLDLPRAASFVRNVRDAGLAHNSNTNNDPSSSTVANGTS